MFKAVLESQQRWVKSSVFCPITRTVLVNLSYVGRWKTDMQMAMKPWESRGSASMVWTLSSLSEAYLLTVILWVRQVPHTRTPDLVCVFLEGTYHHLCSLLHYLQCSIAQDFLVCQERLWLRSCRDYEAPSDKQITENSHYLSQWFLWSPRTSKNSCFILMFIPDTMTTKFPLQTFLSSSGPLAVIDWWHSMNPC